MAYFAHSMGDGGNKHLLKGHLTGVANLAREFGRGLDMEKLAYFTALLHDVGKYGELFQRRLKGLENGIDHWSFGAKLASGCNWLSAVAIQGHHIGLQRLNESALNEICDYQSLTENHPMGLRVSEADQSILMTRMMDDKLAIEKLTHKKDKLKKVSKMLDTRMLYSTLVDADFIDTDNHFHGRVLTQPPRLEPDNALNELKDYINKLQINGRGTEKINSVRTKLRNACTEMSDEKPGLFTLSAPTGSGKTLSMLTFALKHALKNNLKRIILVIPYLSIIEQTSNIYQDALRTTLLNNPNYLFEHHSNSNITELPEDKEEDEIRARINTLSANWNSPIIITTSIQFLHSLFSNKPFACRKLHNIANSVILFDEVQTLPLNLILPTLATLARLPNRYKSSVVFATATQPAFPHLDREVSALGDYGWKPKEIAPSKLDLYSNSKRVKVDWSMVKHKVTYSEVADKISNYRQVLCVCNLKRQAREIIHEIGAIKPTENMLLLSTELPPIHRINVIKEVKSRLTSNEECILISTQCIEAGVDIDFPVAFRALGPLDSIAQVAGRCNRNGRLKYGTMFVFKPEDGNKNLYPSSDYANSAEITEMMLNQHNYELDIDDPMTFENYYKKLYNLTEMHELSKELERAITGGDFVRVAKLYKIINQDTVSILVPYNIEEYTRLADEVRENGISASWMKRASLHSIQVYRSNLDKYLHYIEVPIKGNKLSSDFFIYLYPDHYDKNFGLILPNEGQINIC